MGQGRIRPLHSIQHLRAALCYRNWSTYGRIQRLASLPQGRNQEPGYQRYSCHFIVRIENRSAFVDGGAISGPVVGTVNALADFSHKMYLLGTEWKSTQAINLALTAGELDIRLFRAYPLMGCYLLISATLSDLIPIESFGTPGWMDYIESMKERL